jgi:hypothetical protein
MIRSCLLPVGMSTSNRIIKPGYEFYQPVLAARQFGLEQVPSHFFLHYLTTTRADLPDVLTIQRWYSLFSDLLFPIPVDLTFTSSAIGFENWWSMWKTHVFRKALGPMLQQIHAEYEAPKEEVLPLVQYFFLTSLNPSSNSICFLCSRKMVRSPGTMMAPPSHSHQLPPWSSSAKMHLPCQKPSCGSSLAPRNRPSSGSEPLTLLPPELKLIRLGPPYKHIPPDYIRAAGPPPKENPTIIQGIT